MDENPEVIEEEENVVCDDDYDPSECNCELCYYAREICEFIQDKNEESENT